MNFLNISRDSRLGASSLETSLESQIVEMNQKSLNGKERYINLEQVSIFKFCCVSSIS